MFIPTTTYRIQFCPDYTFNNLADDLGYLNALGISTIYASPIFKARPGSMHGYDVIDMNTLNPELGTIKDFEALIQKVHNFDMSWIQDIVPNHMAFITENDYIRDILENGPKSKYAHFFDIFWDHHDKQLVNRLMVPFLGANIEEVIEQDELSIYFDNTGFSLKYYENLYPINIPSYEPIFRTAESIVDAQNKQDIWQQWKSLWREAKTGEDEAVINFKKFFSSKILNSDFLSKTVHDVCKKINNDHNLLSNIHDQQHYQLCYWKATENYINYRRFFTVNDLICVSVEDEEVFNATHKLVKHYCNTGVFQGVRIDHIDGLLNPRQYLEQLRGHLGEETYIVAEKILARHETLDTTWPIQGTTGYDFLGHINELFIEKDNEHKIDKIYSQLVDATNLHQLIYEKKRFILENRMTGELNNLWHELQPLLPGKANKNKAYEALKTLLSSLPIYRTYIDKSSAGFPEALNTAFDQASGFNPVLKAEIQSLKPYFDNQETSHLSFIERFQQLSGPLAAKGVEDTVYYVYNRFIMQNEVGDEPDIFGQNNQEFLDNIKHRFALWPHTMNTTATHDTKRGEDVRARLSVISEIPELWQSFINEMNDFHFLFKPIKNDQYLIWQSIIGAWPMHERPDSDFKNRLKQFVQKALREGKSETSWSEPDHQYEASCLTYCDALLENHESKLLLQQMVDQTKIPGIIKSLGQVILKFTLPGTADLYQGDELWNQSFVDPDNRRMVDYEKRKAFLFEIQQEELKGNSRTLFFDLWMNKLDEKLKFYITYCLLKERNRNRDLHLHGKLIPIESSNELITFARKHEASWLYVSVPVRSYDTAIPQSANPELPVGLPNEWRHILTNDQGTLEELKKINALTVLTNN